VSDQPRHPHEPPSRPQPRRPEDLAEDLIAVHRRRRHDPDWRPSPEWVQERLASLLAPRRRGSARALPPVATATRLPAATPTPTPDPARARSADAYDGVRRTFEENERWLRRNAAAMDRLVEHMRVDPAAPPAATLQRELRIALPAGGAGRGYFALRNGEEARREVTIETVRTRGLPPGAGQAPAVRIAPDRLVLEPGETREIRVGVDLAGCAIGPADEVEIGLRARSGDEAWTWVWVVLLVDEDGTDG